MLITKSDGATEEFNPAKFRRGLLKVGANKELVEQVLAKVEKKMKPGMSTREIYKIARNELGKSAPGAKVRYNLRQALIRMGPAGYNFEKYIASILKTYGYKAQTPFELQGKCTTHEVDVTAEKDGQVIFIEAKFRRNFYDKIGIKTTLSSWARYMDLREGSKTHNATPNFNQCWVVTNARFTNHSLEYAKCQGMTMLSWNYPKDKSLADMVNHRALYPLTIIDEIQNHEFENFARHKLMLCKEVESKTPDELTRLTGIKGKRAERIIQVCKLATG
ncbi:MAG: hypothetical protein COT81_04725 [Candidatus Buchananbacteria bacterium CG10_big_fil_rev_8_21_14_0_10_42_9]|uniref:ATP-cone domain-containing protein n=1 Tax=Candidatus Buchananbacteria bacterium CG10_big_fil_rev_8_21_14_0_10_42_9 TaxID=1974526 RepID=A0A2H0W2P1_9BACT|nr:MAG: hypothetical protein COT81_04725 [Candidatus Buchananbacteria bacterium CG10_big_fil_rev_8_21_14_0_10_42_9]